MIRYSIFSSEGILLKFKDTDEDLHNEYLYEEMALSIKYYKLLRKRNGIYATNQGKYVGSPNDLNDWDNKYMESLIKGE